jgi:hypothetical protein
MRLSSKIKASVMVAFTMLSASTIVMASPITDVTQTINSGVLSTDILDATRAAVASPTFAMSAKSFSFDCYAGGSASTGTLGSNTQRLYVTNPSGANNGWTLSLAATGGATSTWSNGGATQKFDFNDPTGGTAGCSDGADADAFAGQMNIDPSVGTLTADCGSCGLTGVTKGSSTAFSQAVTDSITLINAASGSDDIWRGYLTGAAISQTIPAEQPADSYTVSLTLTATAL